MAESAVNRFNEESRKAQNAGEHLYNEAKSTADTVVQGVKKAGADAKRMAQEGVEHVRENASAYARQGRDKAMEVEDMLATRIRERPVQSLLIAAGIGCVIGLMCNRR